MNKTSAGILLYKRSGRRLEVLLVHPGGPFFKNKDKGWWTIPKGEPAEGEELIDVARREFKEELGLDASAELIELGSVKQKGGKVVHAWAAEGDLPKDFELHCNTFKLEWPPKSGRFTDCPEIDKAQFFDLPTAREYINAAQVEFIERLEEKLAK
jgi:predicted NUDIX family NTP pyrophosphohydrolase